ncbi:MAG: F0F1 ATP synthase subunit A [Phycisphaerales bacterium]|nr:F0F1 ATP synthase subunit A [Phycisphaerales bacterium]
MILLAQSDQHAPAAAHEAAAGMAHAAADAASHAAEHVAGAGHHHAAPHPLDHVVDVVFMKAGNIPVLTLHMITLLISTLLLVWVMTTVGRNIATGADALGNRRYVPRGRLAQLFESIIIYLRDEMIRPILGDQLTKRWLTFLLTLFFFIWFNNLLGLVPLLSVQHLAGGIAKDDWHWALIGGTATGNISVTAALALIAFVAIQINGFRELGLGGWLHHLLGGAPWWLAPLMIPVELVGMIIKPCALAIRLFANMLAGHTLMATVLLFGYMALDAGLGWLLGLGAIGLVASIFALVLSFLELFVATLQAFVFMFLTTVFIGQMSHHDEEHEHGDDQHGHDHAADSHHDQGAVPA